MYEIQGTHNLDGLKVQNCQKNVSWLAQKESVCRINSFSYVSERRKIFCTLISIIYFFIWI